MSSLFMELLVLQPHLVGHVMHLLLGGGGHRVGDHVAVVRVGTAATSRIASQVQCVLWWGFSRTRGRGTRLVGEWWGRTRTFVGWRTSVKKGPARCSGLWVFDAASETRLSSVQALTIHFVQSRSIGGHASHGVWRKSGGRGWVTWEVDHSSWKRWRGW